MGERRDNEYGEEVYGIEGISICYLMLELGNSSEVFLKHTR